jgi:hypothetical protein
MWLMVEFLMSRQFRFYLLPSDIETLIAELRVRVGVKIIQTPSLSLNPIELDSPISNRSGHFRTTDSVSVWCCLTALSDADIRMRFIPTHSHWIVESRSEVIEFSGCDFNGKFLLIGRLYFQDDMLIDDMICPKRKEFVKWADQVFRATKKILRYSKALDAYLGEKAEEWQQIGGRFASGFRLDGEPY